MIDSRIDFLYLSEQDMIKAGVCNMAGCLTSMEDMFKLLGAGDYRMGGDNGNEHGIRLFEIRRIEGQQCCRNDGKQKMHKSLEFLRPDRKSRAVIIM